MDLLNTANVLLPSSFWPLYQTVLYKKYTIDELCEITQYSYKIESTNRTDQEVNNASTKIKTIIQRFIALNVFQKNNQRILPKDPSITTEKELRAFIHRQIFSSEHENATDKLRQVLCWLTFQQPYTPLSTADYRRLLSEQFQSIPSVLENVAEMEISGIRKWLPYLGLGQGDGDTLLLNPTRIIWERRTQLDLKGEMPLSDFFKRINQVAPIFQDSPINQSMRNALQNKLDHNQIGPILSTWFVEQSTLGNLTLLYKDDSPNPYLVEVFNPTGTNTSEKYSHVVFS